jgi:outer membrane receptor protein involved in Fe transport
LVSTTQCSTTCLATLNPNNGSLFCSYSGPEIRIVNPSGTYGGRFPTVAGLAEGQSTTFTRDVGSYTLWDWQTKYDFSKELAITGGIKNVLDTKPPFSVQDAGGGNQRSFDARYSDPTGRAYYLTASYKF